MGDLTSLLQSLFGGSNNTSTSGTSVPTVPTLQELQTGTGQAVSGLNTNTGLTGLQMGQLGLGAANGLLSAYLGFSGLNQARQQAKQAQSNWNKQWDANVKTTNASLSDRQAARVASNPTAYEGVDSYMKRYGIS